MTPNLINVKIRNKSLALIVKAKLKPQKNQFLTDAQNPLQLGVLDYPKNATVKPHLHRQITKTTHKNQEFIYLVEGQVKVEFFYKRKLIQTETLDPGDCLLQLSGGHGFTFLKPSKLITVKQGPYHDRAREKTIIDTR
jgi:hypothetical protein